MTFRFEEKKILTDLESLTRTLNDDALGVKLLVVVRYVLSDGPP
jgi:hypothetical protein